MHLCAGACVFALLLASAQADSLNIETSQALIANSIDAQPEDVPWHVSIYKQNQNRYAIVCGGTLVAPTFVITAAHCFATMSQADVRKLKVALGNYKTIWTEHEPSTQQIGVKRLISHEEYQEKLKRYEFDIALLELTAVAKMTDKVQIAHIDLDNMLEPDTGKVAGRGLTEKRKQSSVLRSINLPYVDRVKCNNLLVRLYLNSPNNTHVVNTLTSDKYCAGFLGQNMSVCNGDSGGGYVTFDPDLKPYVRGVVSIDFRPSGYNVSANGCFSQLYTAFTNVTDTRYILWITQRAPAILDSLQCEAVSKSVNDDNYWCERKERKVECSLPMKWNTVATVSCKQGYVLNTNSGGKTYARCMSNGKWSGKLATCNSMGQQPSPRQPSPRQPSPRQPSPRPPQNILTDCPFQCQSGHCINAYQRCNGAYDCPNGDDEYNCVQQAPAGRPSSKYPGNHDSYINNNGCHVQVTRYSKNGGIETKTRTTCQQPGGGTSWDEQTKWSSG